jgi:hypothetical protein
MASLCGQEKGSSIPVALPFVGLAGNMNFGTVTEMSGCSQLQLTIEDQGGACDGL